MGEQREKGGAVLIVDGGDLFFEKEGIPEGTRTALELKAHLLVEGYNKIGCDALNVGERDLALGLPFLRELEKKAKFPFLSANLVGKDGTLLFKPYVTRKIGSVSVGILGITGDTAQIAAQVKKLSGGAVRVVDAVGAAAAAVKELQGKVDLVIALTHQNVGRDWVVARRVRGIDVIIGGHDRQKVAEPHVADGTRIVQAGEKGQYLGHMEVAISPDGSRSYRNRLVAMGKDITDNGPVKAMIGEYYRKIAALHAPKEQGPEVSLRAASCSSCHERQHSQWRGSRHAAAYGSLVRRERQFDPDCLPCHTTLFGEPDGFSIQSHPRDMVQVQCESCHGVMTQHGAKKGKTSAYQPAKEMCLKCHTAERSPSFERDYQTYLKKVKH